MLQLRLDFDVFPEITVKKRIWLQKVSIDSNALSRKENLPGHGIHLLESLMLNGGYRFFFSQKVQ